MTTATTKTARLAIRSAIQAGISTSPPPPAPPAGSIGGKYPTFN